MGARKGNGVVLHSQNVSMVDLQCSIWIRHTWNVNTHFSFNYGKPFALVLIHLQFRKQVHDAFGTCSAEWIGIVHTSMNVGCVLLPFRNKIILRYIFITIKTWTCVCWPFSVHFQTIMDFIGIFDKYRSCYVIWLSKVMLWRGPPITNSEMWKFNIRTVLT